MGIVVILVLFAPAPRTQIIYMPVETTERQEGLGCLPLIIVVFLMLVVLGVMRLS
jgi:hypothetical protein